MLYLYNYIDIMLNAVSPLCPQVSWVQPTGDCNSVPSWLDLCYETTCSGQIVFITLHHLYKALKHTWWPWELLKPIFHGYWGTFVLIIVLILFLVTYILSFNVDARIFSLNMSLALYLFWKMLLYNFYVLKGIISSKGWD